MVLLLVTVGAMLTYVELLQGVREWDHSVNEHLAASRSDRFEELATAVSRKGDTLPIIAFGAVVAIAFALARRWRSAMLVPLALLIEVTTFAAVNFIVRRPRPDVETVGSVPSTFSYPSGHVAATLVCWFGLALLCAVRAWEWPTRLVASAGIVATVLMGWARVYLGLHHVLDVVFGIAMGIASLSIAAGALQLWAGDDADDHGRAAPDR
jgi:undecaprenyl-diphosphatase